MACARQDDKEKTRYNYDNDNDDNNVIDNNDIDQNNNDNNQLDTGLQQLEWLRNSNQFEAVSYCTFEYLSHRNKNIKDSK